MTPDTLILISINLIYLVFYYFALISIYRDAERAVNSREKKVIHKAIRRTLNDR